MRKANIAKKIKIIEAKNKRNPSGKNKKSTSSYQNKFYKGHAPDGYVNRFNHSLGCQVTHMGKINRFGKEDPEKMQGLFSLAISSYNRHFPDADGKALIKQLNRTSITLEYYTPSDRNRYDYTVDISKREKMIYVNPEKPEQEQADILAEALSSLVQKDNASQLIPATKPAQYTHAIVALDKSLGYRNASIEICSPTTKNVVNKFSYHPNL